MRKTTIYRIKNWAAYNQSLVQRGNLTVLLSEEALAGWRYAEPTQRSAQFLYSDLVIETTLTFRKLFRLPLRQIEEFVQLLLDMMNVSLRVPDHTTLSRRQKGLSVDLPIWLRGQPRHLLIDSTELKLHREWKTRQHGWTRRRTWRKLHLGIDADTGEVTAETLTEAEADDASQVKPMLA